MLFLMISFGGLATVVMMIRGNTQPRITASFAPAYSMAGQATKTADRVFTHMLPIDSLDEGALGDRIAEIYKYQTDTGSSDAYYIRKLMSEIAMFKKKPFKFRAYVLNTEVPNAFAMPGGIIVVTRGLLNTLESEAQLIAILAHEMGHVEIGHCLDAVKFSLLARKVNLPPLGQLADMTTRLLLKHTYSKTEEDEADAYAFKLLLQTSYNPSALGEAFRLLLENTPDSEPRYEANIVYDYVMTHTPTEIREDRYRTKANMWWQDHVNVSRYNGVQNLKLRMTFSSGSYASEWVTKERPINSNRDKSMAPILLQK